MGLVGLPMEGIDGGRLHGLANEPTVGAALDAIDQALEQVLMPDRRYADTG
jgi:hypothetical protein